MKQLLRAISFLFVCISISFGQSSWTKIPTGTAKSLWGIRFRTPDLGWAVGGQGVVLRTTNGGQSWIEDSVAFSNTRPLLNFIDFQDSVNVWVGRWTFPYFHSTDGGSTWASRSIDSVGNISRVYFLKPNLSYAAGLQLAGEYRGRILRSTDGWATWETLLDVPHRAFYDVCFVDSLLGVAVGGTNPAFDNFDPETIYRTTDGGVSWNELNTYSGGQLHRVTFSDTSNGWAGGDWGRLLRTTDGGLTWNSPSFSRPFNWISSIVTIGPADVWVCPNNYHSLFHSGDSGSTWETISFPEGTRLMGLYFSDPYHGWAVGDSGSMWRYDFVTSAPQLENDIPSPSLLNNYPNPFNPSTTIRFSLSKPTFVTLQVFDVLGRRTAVLANSAYGMGVHETIFHGEGLTSGLYFYVLTTDDRVLVGKMALVR